MKWRAGAAVVGLMSLAGCSNPGYFVCTLDSECTEADGGRCEPSGACSIPDTSCPTGRRYGQLGNPEVAGQCVPPDDIGSTGTDPTMGTAGASSGTTAPEATGTGSSGSTTVASSSGGTSDDTGSSSGGESSGSSSSGATVPRDMWADCGEGAAECSQLCVSVLPPLAQEPVGQWCTGFVCDDPLEDCVDPGTGAVPACLEFEFEGDVEPRCFLDCTVSGQEGCPAGMVCFTNIPMSPARCAYPIPE